MLLRSAAMAFLLMTTTAHAADPAKEGTDTYVMSYVVISRSTMQMGNRTIALTEFDGISGDTGRGSMFDKMGARCLGMSQTVDDVYVGRGSCTNTATDGDQIFIDYEYKREAGVYTITGGTGKYAGISGTADYTIQTYRAADGRLLFIVPHHVRWKLF